MSFILNKLETNFQILEESYKILHNKISNNEQIEPKYIDLINLIISSSNKLSLEIDNLSINLEENNYKHTKNIENEVNELKHQDKVISKIIPLYFLIDNYVRTESK